MKCKICNKEISTQTFTAREMQLATLHEFKYIECEHCGCVQLCNPPSDLTYYYPDNYYSFHTKTCSASFFKKFIAYHFYNSRLGNFDIIGFLYRIITQRKERLWLYDGLKFDSKILDVGCGDGALIKSMHNWGFTNLWGNDPFIEKDLPIAKGLTLLKRTIYEIEDTFDYIMLHHSLEHMEQQKETLERLKKMLNKKGQILIRIPLSSGESWKKYRENFYHLDAPRHYFLHSLKSFELLCSDCNLKIRHFYFDTTAAGIVGSKRYTNNQYGPIDLSAYSKTHLRSVEKHVRRINEEGEGDTAVFYLQHP